jgi:hypothetical protein
LHWTNYVELVAFLMLIALSVGLAVAAAKLAMDAVLSAMTRFQSRPGSPRTARPVNLTSLARTGSAR